MKQILNLLENLDFAINSTIDLKGLKVLLRKQQQVHEEFNEMKQNFEDENYQFYREKYQTVLIFKEKCDLLIQDLKVIFNVSSGNVSLVVLYTKYVWYPKLVTCLEYIFFYIYVGYHIKGWSW